MNDARAVERLSPAELKTPVPVRVPGGGQAGLAEPARYVQSWPAGATVYAEGELATCFFVLLSGTLSMHRQVENTDVETTRTNQRGVYAGATQAFVRAGGRARTRPRCGRSPTARSG